MKKKLYIAVDVQNDFVTGCLGSNWAKTTSENILHYLKSAKKNENTFGIWATQDTHEADTYSSSLEGVKLPVPHCINGSKGWDLIDGLKDIVDRTITKPTFMSEELGRAILQIADELDEIVLMGFCTSICVISNAINLRGLMPDMKITVLEDLCADVSPESHIAACTVLRNCQIEVNVPTPVELDTRIMTLTSVRPSDEEIETIVFGMLNSPKYNIRDDRPIDKSSKFKTDCLFDSLDEIEFLLDIEEKFAISIADEEAMEVETIGDAIKLISSKKN